MKCLQRPNQKQSLWRQKFKYLIMIMMALMVLLLAVVLAQSENFPNKYCPVTTNELAEKQFFVDYQDQRIYFCCNGCKRDFLNNPEAYMANLEPTVIDSAQSESTHAHDEGVHEHRETIEKIAVEDQKKDTTLAHNHATDHVESFSLVGYAGKFHPMMTHFPVALVLSALLFLILGAVLKNQSMNLVSVYIIYLAAVTGIGTVLLGLAAGSTASYPTFLSDFLNWHRWLGISSSLVTILSAFLGSRMLRQLSKKSVWSFKISVFINAILIGVTGHLGGILVFGPDYFKF